MAAGPQAQLQAQARVQAAQVGCAQADAYQARVDALVNSQNNLSQGMDQILQTVADNTTNPDLQNALLNAIGQPNPINDALSQQLEALAGTYESTCQARLSAAQAALPAGSSQQAAPTQDGGQGSTGDPGDQGGSDASVDTPIAPPPPPPDAGQLTECPAVAAGNLPQPRGPWGPWGVAGNSGLVFDVSRVNPTTVTWRFFNAGSNTIAAMQFNYSYVDAGTGQNATQTDGLPYPLAPGQAAGGWAAYSANTRGDIKLAITQVSCQ